jgi:hypothetical protein
LTVTEYFDDIAIGTYIRQVKTGYSVNWQSYFNAADYGIHTIKITATYNSIVENRIFTFTKIQNLHAIYDNDPDMTTIYDVPTINYSITDSECNENKIVESFDGKAVKFHIINTLEIYTTDFREYRFRTSNGRTNYKLFYIRSR